MRGLMSKVRHDTNGSPPKRSTVPHVTILAIANSLLVIVLAGLSAAPCPGDRVLYVVFSPWNDRRVEAARIVAAGGRRLDQTAWPFVYKVAFDGNDGLARLEAGGAVLALTAGRLPICSTPRERV